MQPGFVVVKLDGKKFEDLMPSYDPDMFVVTAAVRETAMLKDLKTDTPVCIRNPNQEVHVLNQYGLSSLDVNVANMIYPIIPSAPGIAGQQQQVAVDSSNGVVSTTGSGSVAVSGGTASTAAPVKKNELIFNFMGFVWGTNDTNPDHQGWMAEVGHEAKEVAKEAANDAKDLALEEIKKELEEERAKQRLAN